MDIYAALNCILTGRDELIPFILQCREDRNEIGEVRRGTQVSKELHAWVEPLSGGTKVMTALRFPEACRLNWLRHIPRDGNVREPTIGSSIRTETH
jgi:hypothetical protein